MKLDEKLIYHGSFETEKGVEFLKFKYELVPTRVIAIRKDALQSRIKDKPLTFSGLYRIVLDFDDPYITDYKDEKTLWMNFFTQIVSFEDLGYTQEPLEESIELDW